MNQEKLKKLQAQVRIGGKGTPRRKKKVIHQTPGTDDKKLQSVLKKLAVNQIPGIEEVNMIKSDGTVIHFNNPKAQASLAANTFAITGHSEQKEVSFHVLRFFDSSFYFRFQLFARIMLQCAVMRNENKRLPINNTRIKNILLA